MDNLVDKCVMWLCILLFLCILPKYCMIRKNIQLYYRCKYLMRYIQDGISP